MKNQKVIYSSASRYFFPVSSKLSYPEDSQTTFIRKNFPILVHDRFLVLSQNFPKANNSKTIVSYGENGEKRTVAQLTFVE